MIHPGTTRRHAAFSLLELMIVIGIASILIVMSTYAMRGVISSSQLTSATDSIFGTLTYARQVATTMSREVEVRLLSVPPPAGSGTVLEIRALQFFEVGDTGNKQIGRTRYLPAGVVINETPTHSSLARLQVQSAGPSDPSLPDIGQNYTYRKFTFRPDGSTTLPLLIQNPTPDHFFLSTHVKTPDMPADMLPANFATIQIEPLTGAVTVYRP